MQNGSKLINEIDGKNAIRMRGEGGLIQKTATRGRGHKMGGVKRCLMSRIRKPCFDEYRGSW